MNRFTFIEWPKPFAAETLAKTVNRAIGDANGNGSKPSKLQPSVAAVTVRDTITADRKMLDILKQARSKMTEERSQITEVRGQKTGS